MKKSTKIKSVNIKDVKVNSNFRAGGYEYKRINKKSDVNYKGAELAIRIFDNRHDTFFDGDPVCIFN